VGSALEVTDDRRQGRGHDRLVERRQQHAQHERADDHQDPPVAEPRHGAVGIRRCRTRGRGSGCCHQWLSFLFVPPAMA
jgi:hypothetical protein